MPARSKGLDALYGLLDANFVKAVNVIAGLKGRLIVTGMGKSGHIAHKIAATFASTGTPSYFVHPSEASHGDMGIITEDDAVLALSNSGETAELKDLVAYTRRFSIPLIGMVRRKNSSLAQAADIALVISDVPEASPTGAPTTSTTQMLVLGDAIAMALLERKGFTHEDFHVFHPGGKLGTALLHVRELMHPAANVALVAPTDPMSKVMIAITSKGFGCAGVVDAKGNLVGIVTDGDLRRHMKGDLLKEQAQRVMTKNPITIKPQTLAAQALRIMNAKRVTSLFVVENKKPLGLLHVHDMLRAGVI